MPLIGGLLGSRRIEIRITLTETTDGAALTSGNLFPTETAPADAVPPGDLTPDSAGEPLLTFLPADDASGVCDLNGGCS
jgi:hypothetical protein